MCTSVSTSGTSGQSAGRAYSATATSSTVPDRPTLRATRNTWRHRVAGPLARLPIPPRGCGVGCCGPAPQARMRGVSRLRRVVVLLLCVVVVAVLAGISLADPFHLRQARWFTAGFIAVALVLLTVLPAAAAPR